MKTTLSVKTQESDKLKRVQTRSQYTVDYNNNNNNKK